MRFGLASPALNVKSGYAIQALLLARHLQQAGHEVTVFSHAGGPAAPLVIEGFPHLPQGRLQYSRDVILDHCAAAKTDVLITICDLAHQDTGNIGILRSGGVQVAHWVPCDGEPLSVIDNAVLHVGGGIPLAMSRHGEKMMTAAGLAPVYIPHGIDTDVFKPSDRPVPGMLRGKFLVGMCGTNDDWHRKGHFEGLHAFARFHAKHPKSMLLIHSTLSGEFDWASEIRLLGIEEAVVLPPSGPNGGPDYYLMTGQLEADHMAEWFGMIDVLLHPSWGEGFGIPVIEAQACGTPVIATDCSALTELVQPGTGWRVQAEPKHQPLHKNHWKAPSIAGLAHALEQAHAARHGAAWSARQRKARAFALRYDTTLVWEQYWAPFIRRLEAGEWKQQPERITVHSGLKWITDDGGFQFGDRLALDHEAALEPHIFRLLPADGVFVDVGAHVGHWALRAAQRCARVIAIEANPGTAARLEENIALNELANVTVHQVAAWDDLGTLYVHNHHGGAERDGTDQVSEQASTVPVTAIRLDDLLSGESRVDVIKIDVEGADLHVLRGLGLLLDRLHPRLFVEDHSVYGMYEKTELTGLLGELGYEWRDVIPGYVEAWPADLDNPPHGDTVIA